jgi:hypothetical protein
MPKFKINDKVWVAHFNHHEQIQVPCCVCYGTKKVILRLGNGDEVELPCDYCGKGNFGIPTGYEIEYQPESFPIQIVINGMEVKITSKGEEVEYWSGAENCHYIYNESKVFATEEEAKAKSEELKQEWLEQERSRIDYLKADAKKNFAWNAGYHLRYVKRLEKDIEYHKEKAKLCKERSRHSEVSE